MRRRYILGLLGALFVLVILFGFSWKIEAVGRCGRSFGTAVKLHKYGLTWSEVVGLSVQECLDDGADPEVPR